MSAPECNRCGKCSALAGEWGICGECFSADHEALLRRVLGDDYAGGDDA